MKKARNVLRAKEDFPAVASKIKEILSIFFQILLLP